MPLAEFIALAGNEPPLEFIIIGGLAVAAHGHTRATFDVDFLVRRSDKEPWRERLLAAGYSLLAESTVFAQYTGPDGAALDLMHTMMTRLISFGRPQRNGCSVLKRRAFPALTTCSL